MGAKVWYLEEPSPITARQLHVIGRQSASVVVSLSLPVYSELAFPQRYAAWLLPSATQQTSFRSSMTYSYGWSTIFVQSAPKQQLVAQRFGNVHARGWEVLHYTPCDFVLREPTLHSNSRIPTPSVFPKMTYSNTQEFMVVDVASSLLEQTLSSPQYQTTPATSDFLLCLNILLASDFSTHPIQKGHLQFSDGHKFGFVFAFSTPNSSLSPWDISQSQ